MGRLAQTEGLTEFEQDILATVRDFTVKEIIPVATELEHRDEYPAQIVDGMKQLGLFGLTIPEQYGGLGASLLLYALAVEEIARGWMSVSGIINTHFIVAHMIARHGTAEQQEHFLPQMAAGEIRGAFSMSEPGVGSDVSAIRTTAVRDGDDFVINGQKMWLTNGGTANLVALLCRTDDGHDRPHRNMTTFLIEKEPGFGPNPAVPGLTVPGKIEKMGYKGVDTTELILEDVRVPAARVLGGVTGRGFYQMMDGVEVGRVNVAARGCGVALRAFELAIDYAQRRYAFGKPIAQHEAIAFKLAEMATKVEAAHQMMVMAARRKDSGHRNDLEAGMAKYLASEYGKEVVEDSFRIHGGYGFSKEYEIERLYREAPMLLIGEGTAEIQKMIIGRRLLEEYRVALAADGRNLRQGGTDARGNYGRTARQPSVLRRAQCRRDTACGGVRIQCAFRPRRVHLQPGRGCEPLLCAPARTGGDGDPFAGAGAAGHRHHGRGRSARLVVADPALPVLRRCQGGDAGQRHRAGRRLLARQVRGRCGARLPAAEAGHHRDVQAASVRAGTSARPVRTRASSSVTPGTP
jgi:alkylation response protein AidB-like acyl-CoA dehydrogenase